MPHVASPSQLLAAELRPRLREVRGSGLLVVCSGGKEHRLGFDGAAFHADDHDEAAEAVLSAVGGTRPPCVALAGRLSAVTTAELWAALTTASGDDDGAALAALRRSALRLLLAKALQDEFADAGQAVRDSVAQLGLAVLGASDDGVDRFTEKFRTTRSLPRWDPGPGHWTDHELVFLARCVRVTPAGGVPHLELLPSHPDARRAVAKYARNLLDGTRVHTPEELRTTLAPTFRNVRALTHLLVAERVLVEDHGRYRVR